MPKIKEFFISITFLNKTHFIEQFILNSIVGGCCLGCPTSTPDRRKKKKKERVEEREKVAEREREEGKEVEEGR